MKLIVAGSRGFNNRTILFDALDNIIDRYNITEIVSGTAKGADSMGEQYAYENSLRVSRFPAKWDIYGKSAGHKRNEEMAIYSDIAIVFWNGTSRGSKNMIKNMKKYGKPVIVNLYNEEDPFNDF